MPKLCMLLPYVGYAFSATHCAYGNRHDLDNTELFQWLSIYLHAEERVLNNIGLIAYWT